MKNTETITLEQFIIERQEEFPFATGDLSSLLRDISIAAKIVNREVNKAGLVGILGGFGENNVQGEAQQKLDVYANDQFIHALRYGEECCVVASEENEDIVVVDDEISENAKYVVLIDPLDGSSNIDVNVSVGTIFSIYRRLSPVGTPGKVEDCLQKGKEQVAAGYVIYGSSTMLVYTTGHGVNGFTLDPSIGEFCLSHRDMKVPDEGPYYSINEGNYEQFSDGMNDYMDYCKSSEGKKPFKGRYIGSMVADLHRNMLKGGIFIYPTSADAPKGKLRLNYECNPFAFIMEQAGGMASNGNERILDIQPVSLHQRSPIIIGSTRMVEKALSIIKDESPVEK